MIKEVGEDRTRIGGGLNLIFTILSIQTLKITSMLVAKKQHFKMYVH